MRLRRLAASLLPAASTFFVSVGTSAQDWKPIEGRLTTPWTRDVMPDQVHSEYPRPTMERPDWILLNGLWDASLLPGDDGSKREGGGEKEARRWEGKILVPFPIESALSGVGQSPLPGDVLRYRRTVVLPVRREPGRWLLHFGAVDWHAVVRVNGIDMGEHRGGYAPFTFDVTDALRPEGEQEIVVEVRDPTDASFQPRGKQVREPHGIWYTSVTGIWQTVWLEPVPRTYIRKVFVAPDANRDEVIVSAEIGGDTPDGTALRALVFDGDREIKSEHSGRGGVVRLSLPDLERWSPDSPKLYDISVELLRGDAKIDEVKSYFAMRSFESRLDEEGVPRFYLNGEPLFLYGPLDQGWWPDGLYTAPTDEALAFDIEVTKRLGFNTIRKHVKVEPERWYWHCDRLGMLVWQDMPSGDRHARWTPFGEFDKKKEGEIERSEESAANYRRELREMVDARRHHPSIVVWVPFNEGWGQFDTAGVTSWLEQYDPERLVDSASGGNDFGTGDLNDIHRYPGPARPKLEKERIAVLGEFGGLGLPLSGHTWQDEKNWGYRSFTSQKDLTRAYTDLQTALLPLIAEGLAAAIYTQTTDVEVEVNGLLTYDRKVLKIDPESLVNLHSRLYEPPPVIRTVVPTSEKDAQQWSYTFERPEDGWELPGFDDSSWKSGPAGFGTEGTPGAVVRTNWSGSDIWLRRTAKLDASALDRPYLRIHHDDDVEVWIEGGRVLERDGWTTSYIYVPIDRIAAGDDGELEIAVHCRQDRGGQYIDVGLVEFGER